MKIVDVNLLLYAVNRDSPNHERVKAWLEDALSSGERVGFPWICILAFLRIATNPKAFPHPLTVDQSFDLMGTWLDQPSVSIVQPGARHFQLLHDLLQPLGTGANLTSDAHLAAVAIENKGTVCSADTDFLRFKGVRYFNPAA